MSLDIYLEQENSPNTQMRSGIFVRKNGQTVEISKEEWDRDNPGREPYIVEQDPTSTEVYHCNITHNMGRMAEAAGIYNCLWRMDEAFSGSVCAKKLEQAICLGIAKMKNDPEHFKQFNPENGWGNYDIFLEFLEGLQQACRENPDATVSYCR